MNEEIRNQQEPEELFITRNCVNFAPLQTLLCDQKEDKIGGLGSRQRRK